MDEMNESGNIREAADPGEEEILQEEDPREEAGEDQEDEAPEEEPGQEEPPREPPKGEKDGEQAQRRRKEEISALRAQLLAERQEREREKGLLKKYRETVALYGYTGDDGEVLTRLGAAAKQVTPEEYRAQTEAQERELQRKLEGDPRYQRMVRHEQEQLARIAMAGDLAEIKAAFPSETAADLDHIKNVEKFLQYRAEKGIPTVEAYKLANFDTLTPRPRATGEDKEHLVRTGGAEGGQKGVDIPAKELELYREAFPGESMAQLRARYNRVLKRQGG